LRDDGNPFSVLCDGWRAQRGFKIIESQLFDSVSIIALQEGPVSEENGAKGIWSEEAITQRARRHRRVACYNLSLQSQVTKTSTVKTGLPFQDKEGLAKWYCWTMNVAQHLKLFLQKNPVTRKG